MAAICAPQYRLCAYGTAIDPAVDGGGDGLAAGGGPGCVQVQDLGVNPAES